MEFPWALPPWGNPLPLVGLVRSFRWAWGVELSVLETERQRRTSIGQDRGSR